MGNLTVWLTPIWVLALGTTAAALVLLVLWGLLWVVSRPTAESIFRLVRESVLQWVSYLVIALAIFCLVATPVMPYKQVLHSLQRLPKVGEFTTKVAVPAHTEDQAVPLAFDSDELRAYALSADQDVVVNVKKGEAFSHPMILVEGGETYKWSPSAKRQRLFNGPVEEVYVSNQSDAPTELTAVISTDVPLVEVRQIPIAAAIVFAIYVVYLLQHLLLHGTAIIALATFKEAVAQPIYILALVACTVAILFFLYIPYNTFGEDVKMFTSTAQMLIMNAAIFVAIWTASVSVAEEIEGRTALTLLSKPIGRWEFVFGKFLGIVWANLLMFVLLGAWLLLLTSYKVVYDARETSNPEPNWQLCNAEMIRIVPGLVLAFLETVIMTAISVAISTRLSILPNLAICGSIYALGHLGPAIVQSSAGQNEFVAFFGQLIALVLPVLGHFDVQAAVSGGVRVPLDYILWSTLYCLLYSSVAMLLALILFEDRDLA